MRYVGIATLIVSFAAAILCPITTAVFRRRRIGAAAAVLSCAFMAAASASLLFLLISGDYSAQYVFRNTDSTLPLIYRISAFWSSSSGSMMLWALCSSVIYLVIRLCRRGKNENRGFINCLSITVSSVNLLFLVFILFINNPFAYAGANADGLGLNPTLQSPGMVIHPPLVMIAYSLIFVAFAAALYELVYSDGAEKGTGERFSLLGWTVLTLGIISGGIWAYTELGWGGYWSWDAIENSAFVTWLLCSAYIHLHTMKGRDAVGPKTLFVLSSATVFSILFGTFLARSGVIESVHAYSGRASSKGFFALILAAAVIVFVVVYIISSRGKKAAKGGERSSFMRYLPPLWMILCAIVIAAMTLSPLFPIRPEIDEKTYDTVFGTAGTALMLMMSAGFAVAGLPKKRAWIVSVIALAAGAALVPMPGFAVYGAFTRVLLSLNAACLAAMCLSFIAYSGRFLRSGRAFAVFMLHLALTVTAIGLIGSRGMKTELTYILDPGDSFYLSGHSVEYNSFELKREDNSTSWIFALHHGGKGAEKDAVISMTLDEKQGIYTSKPFVSRSTAEDFFLIAENAADDGGLLLKVIISRWISFLWAGLGLMLLSAIYIYIEKSVKRS
ncbi:MAG: cytochrome c biogenesis protein CcsA [Oscillospiraceae bacterium]|nr:cytochrome c biogenesis protein CcsA [Oscillospiraceae bacterium]